MNSGDAKVGGQHDRVAGASGGEVRGKVDILGASSLTLTSRAMGTIVSYCDQLNASLLGYRVWIQCFQIMSMAAVSSLQYCSNS